MNGKLGRAVVGNSQTKVSRVQSSDDVCVRSTLDLMTSRVVAHISCANVRLKVNIALGSKETL